MVAGVRHDRFDRGRIRRVAVGADELEADHRADPADVADAVELALQGEHPLKDAIADRACALEQSLLLDHVEGRERRGDRHGVAPEGAAQLAGLDLVHDLGLADHRRQREARRQGLRARHEVGLDVDVIDRPPGAGAADPGLHLVVDPEGSDLVRVAPQRTQERRRRRNEAAFARHRLEYEGRDLGGADGGFDPLPNLGEIRLAAAAVLAAPAVRAAQAVGVLHAVDLGRARSEAGLVRIRLAGQRQRHVRASVERVRERHDALAPGGHARDLDRVLDRFGARVGQEHPLLARARRDRGEALGELDVARMHAHGEAEVLEFAQLGFDGRTDARMRVPDVHRGDAGGPVEVARALGVPHVRAVGPNRVEGVDRVGGPSDGGGAPAVERLVGRTVRAARAFAGAMVVLRGAGGAGCVAGGGHGLPRFREEGAVGRSSASGHELATRRQAGANAEESKGGGRNVLRIVAGGAIGRKVRVRRAASARC